MHYSTLISAAIVGFGASVSAGLDARQGLTGVGDLLTNPVDGVLTGVNELTGGLTGGLKARQDIVSTISSFQTIASTYTSAWTSTAAATATASSVAVATSTASPNGTITLLDLSQTLELVTKTVVADVASIGTLIGTVGKDVAGQDGLVKEIVGDLTDIVGALTTAVGGVLGQTIPTVLKVVVDEVGQILSIIHDLEVIVFQIVSVLLQLVDSLLDSTLHLVTDELDAVFNLLGPVLTPVFKFVGVAQCDACGNANLLQEIEAAVAGILKIVNPVLSGKGLSIISL